jgi:hypothetical protein
VNARQCEIFQLGSATVLFGDNVIGFVGEKYAEAGDAAVFAAASRPFKISGAEGQRDMRSAHAASRKCCQAAALIEVTRWSRWSISSNSAFSASVSDASRFLSSNSRSRA